MRGDQLAAVDAADFKKAWEIRQAHPHGAIDVEIFPQHCKPETNAKAAGMRATALMLLIQIAPEDMLKGAVVEAQPTEALLEAFADMPLTEGEAFSVQELLRSVREGL